tara:strand:- start:157 stop:933 length:777 start_codon:yes stop_codon:yes gene_type:complete
MRVISILFFLTFLILPLFAQQTAQLEFDKANTLLEEGDYRGALKGYQKIESQGSISGPLYLNMGISAVQIDSLGLAKYYFLKTIKYFPEIPETSAQAARALEFVNSQFSRQSATLPKLPWDKAVDWLKEGPSSSGVFWLGYSLGMIAIIIVLGNWFHFFSFKKQHSLILIFAISSVLIIALAFYVSYIDKRYDEAVMVHQEAQVFQSPDEISSVVSLAYEGYTLTIDFIISNDNPAWYYVRLGNGQYGWINKNVVYPL